MPDLRPFAFSISPAKAAGWTWRALRHDGRVEEGAAPTRAAAAACVIRVFAQSPAVSAPSPRGA